MAYIYKEEENLIKEGDYEVLIESIEKKTLPSGKEKLAVKYRIRTDIEQESKNRCVFEDIWQEKDNPGTFNRKKINKILGTQEVTEGQEFETINDVINFLKGSALIIHLAIVHDDYWQKDVNTVSYYKKTKVVNQTVGGEPKEAVNKIIEEDTLPF